MIQEIGGLILILMLFSPRVLLLWLLARKPRPVANLICVITGGAGEIGRVLSDILLKKGAVVIVLDVSKCRIDEMVKQMNSEHLHCYCVDVSSFEAVQKIGQKIIHQFGGIDILINNAAIANPFDIEESSVEELTDAMSTNLMSHFWTIRTFLPALRKSKIYNGLHGSVVAISSVLGGIGTGGLQTYCSSKAGIIGLMESLYMQHTDIHWCTVAPFLINTQLFKGMRHRYMDYMYPILDKHEVGKRVVSAIEYQESYVSIPWFWNYCFLLIKNIFPLYVTKFAQDCFHVREAYLTHKTRQIADSTFS